MSRFDDRLDGARYNEDPLCGFGLGEGTPGNADSVWVPERIADRVAALGQAYELHFLPLIHAAESVRFNVLQAQSLYEELTFIGSRVEDPLLDEHLERIAQLVSRGVREGVGVTFEGQ